MGVEPDEGLEREVPGILGIPNPADQVGVKRNTVPLDDTFERGVLIGEARPTASINHDDFWMHGFNAGVEVTW